MTYLSQGYIYYKHTFMYGKSTNITLSVSTILPDAFSKELTSYSVFMHQNG